MRPFLSIKVGQIDGRTKIIRGQRKSLLETGPRCGQLSLAAMSGAAVQKIIDGIQWDRLFQFLQGPYKEKAPATGVTGA